MRSIELKPIELGSVVTVRRRSPMNSAGCVLKGIVYDIKDEESVVCYKNKLQRCDSVPKEDVIEVHCTMSIEELLTCNDSTLRSLGKRLFEGRDPVWSSSPLREA